jgi:PAS domain S-box-containing protein
MTKIEWASPEDGASDRLIDTIDSHAVFVLDQNNLVEQWSDSARRLYGYDEADVLGEPLSVLFSETATWERPPEVLLEEAKTEQRQFSNWHQRADGTVFWGKLDLSPIRDGQFQGWVVVCENTTEQHQRVQLLKRQNDRLKEFTDILVHDLRNPLNVILTRIELARRQDDPEHLDVLEETAHRMDRLVDDLLRVARQGNPVTDPEPTGLEGIVQTSWEGTGGEYPEATLTYEDVGTVAADGDRLCELFENLFRNSVEHAGSDVTVRVGPLEDGFYVEDDGPGIDADHRDEVFGHGYSTTDEGSGYGLSVVRTIAGAHGWDPIVTDSESHGARFEFTGLEFLD